MTKGVSLPPVGALISPFRRADGSLKPPTLIRRRIPRSGGRGWSGETRWLAFVACIERAWVTVPPEIESYPVWLENVPAQAISRRISPWALLLSLVTRRPPERGYFLDPRYTLLVTSSPGWGPATAVPEAKKD